MKKETTEKILLVDDEESIRKVLSISLRDSGYQVLTAANGQDALRLFESEHPAIVLTDIKMPGMTGIELLDHIKKTSKETEVIMISGHGDMSLAIESLKRDAVDFITKPINDDILEIALKRALERIEMRRTLRAYTENLEKRVQEQAAKLVKAEKILAVSKAFEGLSAAIWNMAGDLEGGIRYFNEMPCLVSIHNAKLQVIAANQLYKERFGDRIGAGSWQVYKGASKEKSRCPVARTLRTGVGQRSREIVEYSDGNEAPVIVHTAPIKNEEEAVEFVLEISADVAEVKQLQEHLSALGLKISMISHSIKGLLTGLDGGMYMIDSGFTKENQERIKEGWAVVKIMITRIRNLVLDILYFAKERDLQWEMVDVFTFTTDVAAAVSTRIKTLQIGFTHNVDPSIGRLKIDPGVVRAALINVIENAMDACVEDTSQKEKKITFTVGQDLNGIFFDITDNGIGMDPETKAKIFTLFFSSKGGQGTGLGLYISQRMIEQHGGSIEVESTKGEGSRFRISLPKGLLANDY